MAARWDVFGRTRAKGMYGVLRAKLTEYKDRIQVGRKRRYDK